MASHKTFESPFDTYTVRTVIGEGGTGRVYEVSNAAGELFALKCLAPERINAERLKRFKNEIAFCQKLDHPNVVKVLDTGAVLMKGVKCPFYVMRRYTGTLRTRMNSLQPDEALPLFSQVLDGVEAAHLAGVWHRDLKPENILWNERDGRLAIADFGIAHFEEEEIYTAVETKVAARMANFLYSAPEQRVRGALVDSRADIFSLGLLLNELFTKEVAQGTGFTRISNSNAAYGYIDELVDAMIQQNPTKRPQNIETIKKEFIGRKNSFVALQQYDVAKKQVVPTNKPPDFTPLTIVGIDYKDGTLSFQLSTMVPIGWEQEFRQPRGGYSFVMGYGPEHFQIRASTMAINVRASEQLIQQVVDNAKNYVAAANRGYVEQQRDAAERKEHEQRVALERKIVEAELRRNVLANVKL